jgi:hypothetical protein
MIDLEKMEKDLIAEYPDEEEEILNGIKVLKGSQTGYALFKVPEELRTMDVCLAAVQQDKDKVDSIIFHIPDAVLNQVKKAAGLE